MINSDVLIAIEWLKESIQTGKVDYQSAQSIFEAMNLEFQFRHLGPRFYRIEGGMIDVGHGKVDFDANKIENIRVAQPKVEEESKPSALKEQKESKTLEANDETVTVVKTKESKSKSLGAGKMVSPKKDTGSFKTKPTTKFGG